MSKPRNISLIIGLLIPVLMVVFVAVSIYLPGMFAPEQEYDFLYLSSDDPYNNFNRTYLYSYSVVNGKLVRYETPSFPEEMRKSGGVPPKLYRHDVQAGKSEELTFEQAAALALDSKQESPDGFKVECGQRSSGFFIFFFDSYNDCSSQYLTGHGVSKKLEVESTTRYNGFRFLGWIIEPNNNAQN